VTYSIHSHRNDIADLSDISDGVWWMDDEGSDLPEHCIDWIIPLLSASTSSDVVVIFSCSFGSRFRHNGTAGSQKTTIHGTRWNRRDSARAIIRPKYMNAPTTSVRIGTPPNGYQEWTTTKVHIHGFADLSTERGASVYSPEFMALGNPWRLLLYPGGHSESRSGWVAIYLANGSYKSIDMNFGFSIKDGNGKQIANMQTSTPIINFGPLYGRGFSDFAKRSKLLDSLVDGTLVLEVHIKPYEPIKAALPQFIPENPQFLRCLNFCGR
jgi:hypothetical protein